MSDQAQAPAGHLPHREIRACRNSGYRITIDLTALAGQPPGIGYQTAPQ
jgi:hypothetical protein